MQWKNIKITGEFFPNPTSGHTVTTLDDQRTIFIFGGLIGISTKRTNLYYFFDTKYMKFLKSDSKKKKRFSVFKKESKQPISRERHTTISLKKKIILFGGIADQKKRLNDVWIMDTSAGFENAVWKECKMPKTYPSPRYNHSACAVSDRQIIVFGGYDGNYLNDVWVLTVNDHDSIEWHEIKFPQNTSLPLPRYQHSAVISGKNMIIFGGKYKHQKLNDVWCLDTESYKWTKVETIGTTPSPRYGHVACCVGKYMIIWGGFSLNIEVNLNGYTNEVYLLDTEHWDWSQADITNTPKEQEKGTLSKTELDNQKHTWLTGMNSDPNLMENESIPPGRMLSGGCVFSENRILIFGGITYFRQSLFRSNDIWVLDTNIKKSSISGLVEKQVGNYKLLKSLGAGGQGVVYLAEDEVTKKKYALKIILLDFIQEGEQKEDERAVSPSDPFNEIMICQQLKHRHVLPIVKFFLEKKLEQTRLNIVMPFCEHGDLVMFCRKQKRWNLSHEPLLIDWFIQILEGLEYIHSKKIIHRDMKPSNIFLINDETDSQKKLLKIADFGMAKNITQSLAKTTCGTPAFMAPELYNNEKYDHSVDIYSFGCIMFFMLTFHSFDFKLESNKQKLFEYMSNIPFRLKDTYLSCIQKCLSTNPKDRPTATQLIKEFKEIKKAFEQLSTNPNLTKSDLLQQHITTKQEEQLNSPTSPSPTDGQIMESHVEDVPGWLRSIGMEKYIENFISQGFDDLNVIAEEGLTDEELDLIGVTLPGHRKKIKNKLKALQSAKKLT